MSGSNSANFTSINAKKLAENLLNEFLTDQAIACDRNGWHMIVAGDINSYHQPAIDHNGGPSTVRPECLSSHLLSLGFYDTFRQRFPITIAFTHISVAGGSRLDQIWIRPALGLMLPIVSACIIWEWPFKSDHSPVAADFFTTIPRVHDQDDRPVSPPWQLLLCEMTNKDKWAKLRDEVLVKIDPFKELIEATKIKLCLVSQAAHSPGEMNPVLARSIIEDAHLAIETNMLNAIPWPEVPPRVGKAPCHWQECIRALHGIRRRLTRPSYNPAGLHKVIKSFNKTWRKSDARYYGIICLPCCSKVHPTSSNFS